MWYLVNHWQRWRHWKHREDREYKKRHLSSESWSRSMSIANIWRIFRNRVLEQGIIGLVQLTARVQTKAHRRRLIRYRRGTIRDTSIRETKLVQWTTWRQWKDWKMKSDYRRGEGDERCQCGGELVPLNINTYHGLCSRVLIQNREQPAVFLTSSMSE